MKLLTCSAAQSLELIVQPERAALTAQLSSLSPDEASEQCFVELALEELKVCTLKHTRTGSVRLLHCLCRDGK